MTSLCIWRQLAILLTTEAATALDDELRRRNLTEADRIEYQRFVKRQEQREAKGHHRKTFGTFKCAEFLLESRRQGILW